MDRNGLKIILIEMLQRVGVHDWPGWEYFEKDGWYLDHAWTAKEQADFEQWMASLMYRNKKIREEICRVPVRRKQHLIRVAERFTFEYGWKLRGGEEIK
jgi:hypothetical protein